MLWYYEKCPKNVFLSFRYSKNMSSIKNILNTNVDYFVIWSFTVYGALFRPYLSGVLSIFVPHALTSVQHSIFSSLGESWKRLVFKSRTKACACAGIHTASGQDEESFHLPSVVSQTDFWSTPWEFSSNLVSEPFMFLLFEMCSAT